MAAKRNVTKRPRVSGRALGARPRGARVAPDADAPLADAEFERGYGAMLARRARAATGLSQSAFAARFGIPVGSLRDWEQGRRAPDAATKNYLRVIARMPNAVRKALRRAA